VHWNLHRLRLFRAVARRLSFTRAASDLAIAQPAVSHQVMAFERDLGVRLLDRHGRGVQLSEAGLKVLEAADEVLGRLDDLSRMLAELEAGERGSVDIAADTTSGIYVVPGVLGAFHRSHPMIDIKNPRREPARRHASADRAVVRPRRHGQPASGDPL
jgi:DNA-binding transcriptional LysR family regulator